MTPGAWRPPWRPGAGIRPCIACGDRVITSTLDDDERCAQCHATNRRPAPLELTPEAARPAELFDPLVYGVAQP